jgi:uncharacterized protein with FMN-binding domain
MRRALPAVVITIVGLGALASFHSAPGSATTAPATVPPTASARPTPATTPAGTAPPPDQTSPDQTSPGSGSGGSGSGSTNAPAPAPATTGPALSTRTVDGDPVDNRYGTVQVRVTLRGSQIVDITPLQMPTDRQRSAEISQQAEPYLRQETLQAQSAQIDIVSGATYTSESYTQSLQSALDKAHA